MLTNENLLLERAHPCGGLQRLYRYKSGYGLSVVNSPILHSYPFAWEIAVLKGIDEKGENFELDYSTGLTEDVEVFDNDEDTNAFINRAAIWLEQIK